MSDNKNKDPIEEFFRKKVWDYDISYNEADWMELEDRLDIRDKQYIRRNKRRWIAAASILLFCLLGYFTYQNYSKINELSRQLNEEAVRQNMDREITEEGLSPGVSDPSGEDRSGRIPGRADDASQTTNPESPVLASEQPEETSQPEHRVQTGDGTIASGNVQVSGRTADQLFIHELTTRDPLVSGVNGNNGPPTLSHLIASEAEIQNRSPILAASSEPIAPVISQNGPSRQSSPRFAVGLVFSPDLSTAGSLSDFYDPGYKIGFELEYNLTRNLGITAGLMQSKVRYIAGGSDYNPPQGYWSSGILPSETIGECFLIDIPISLKYSFLQLNRSRFFATAGLSSYIMQNEDYRFYYDQSYSGQVQSWSGKTGTRHWISNANFSIGYEFDLRRNWSLQAEPFVKIPLKEVGWGNVKLYSMGSFVSINYKIQ